MRKFFIWGESWPNKKKAKKWRRKWWKNSMSKLFHSRVTERQNLKNLQENRPHNRLLGARPKNQGRIWTQLISLLILNKSMRLWKPLKIWTKKNILTKFMSFRKSVRTWKWPRKRLKNIYGIKLKTLSKKLNPWRFKFKKASILWGERINRPISWFPRWKKLKGKTILPYNRLKNWSTPKSLPRQGDSSIKENSSEG